MTTLPRYLQELKELEAKATPGEWKKEDHRHKGDWRSTGIIWSKEDPDSFLVGHQVCRINEKDLSDENVSSFEADGDLICAMKNALPRILKEYAAMKEALHNYHWRDHKLGMKDRSEAQEVLEAIEKGE